MAMEDLPALRRLLLIAGSLLYLVYALITPPFQTPDEHQHLFRAWQLAHFQLHGERRGDQSGGMVPIGFVQAAVPEIGTAAPHIVGFRPIPKRPLSAMFGRHTTVSDAQPRTYANFLGAEVYSPGSYGPQIVAVRTGMLLGLSAENTVRLGRLLNAALTLGLFVLALTILPVGRRYLLLVALMPMTAAISASLGQDGLILGSSAMLIALALRARVEERWTRGSIALLAVFGAIMAVSKIVYLPLVGLALFPVPRGARPFPWLAWPILVGIGGAAIAAWWLHSNAGAVVRSGPDIAEPAAQLAFILAHPLAFIAVLGRTAILCAPYVFVTTFTFGWMNVGPVFSAAVLALSSFALASWDGEALPDALGRIWRRWAALVIMTACVGIVTALYLISSRLGGTIADGLQGRYFIPFVPLLGLLASRRRTANGGDRTRLSILLMLGANAAALAAIGGAYYTL